MGKSIKSLGVVTFPMSRRGDVALLKLVNLLSSLSDELYIITGTAGEFLSRENTNRVHSYPIEHKPGTSAFSRVLSYIWTQLRISYKFVGLTSKANLWIFYTGGEYLLLPMLTAKLWRKRVVLLLVGPGIEGSRALKEPMSGIVVFLARINCALADRLIVYSEKLIEQGGLARYKDKIAIAYEYFLELDKFRIQKPLIERKNLVGYIGGLSKEKGILNFLEAIPKIIKGRNDIDFLIGGDGLLQSEVEEYLSRAGLADEVRFVGWIPHQELPHYLNDLTLLVLPSYTEGLPGMVLEAMACGTPVLATPVGIIPEVIKEDETGFIMENNSPECIARNVVRALNHPDLGQIVQNARKLVEQEYTYEIILGKCQQALEGLVEGEKQNGLTG